jgi:hypothetical protein
MKKYNKMTSTKEDVLKGPPRKAHKVHPPRCMRDKTIK